MSESAGQPIDVLTAFQIWEDVMNLRSTTNKNTPMETTVRIETITPERAKQLLENNAPYQRKMKLKTYVAKLATDMREGRWHTGPDSVLIIKGLLANAQHRMAAVVESGTTQKFSVMYSDDVELYKFIDCGCKRSVADTLFNVKNAKTVAAIAATALQYDKRQLSWHGTAYMITRGEIEEFCHEFADELQASTLFAMGLKDKKLEIRLVPTTLTGAFHFCAINCDGFQKSEVEDFLFACYNYSGIHQSNAAQQVYSKFYQCNSKKLLLPRNAVMAYIFLAFKRHIENSDKKINLLQGGAFPYLTRMASDKPEDLL